ncbi:MAG: hypothetical protein AB7I35_17450 [Ramlibacter sp.]
MTYVKVVPTVPVLTLAVLVTPRSALVTTLSVSAAEQMPDVQDADGLLLATVAGGVMVATLVTDVCALANPGKTKNRLRHSQAIATSMARADSKFSRENCFSSEAPEPFKSRHSDVVTKPLTHRYMACAESSS